MTDPEPHPHSEQEGPA